MKRVSEEKDLEIQEKRLKSLNDNYFLSINSGLIYDKIINYRIIINEKDNNLPIIMSFLDINEAENYIQEHRLDKAIIRAVVYQNGFYLLDKQGSFIDKKTALRYSYVAKERYSEWDLYYLKQEILLDTI